MSAIVLSEKWAGAIRAFFARFGAFSNVSGVFERFGLILAAGRFWKLWNVLDVGFDFGNDPRSQLLPGTGIGNAITGGRVQHRI